MAQINGNNPGNRNRFTFGFGTIGRDMVYSLISMFMLFYLTDIINLPTETFVWVSGIIFITRFYDALNDPFMGFIVDNTRSRWGKFKPWIASGAALSCVFTVLLFTDFKLEGGTFIIWFAVFYLLWEISFTANDIAYWSMLPALSVNQKEREKIGAVARICANIGLFFVVAGIVPLTELFGGKFGGMSQGYFAFAVLVSLVMLAGQSVTLFGVKEENVAVKQESTPLRELFRVIYKNDQLFITAIAMSLFMIGYMTTTSFGLYFFKYAYGDEGMYSIFALILGISQLTALSVFPLFSKRFSRGTLYTAAIIIITAGYLIFFFAPLSTMIFIGAAGVLIFVGQSFIQLLMLMFLADSVDYGHWKLGKRNDSINFSLQPLINKMGGAVASGIVSFVIIVSGIKDAESAKEVTANGLLIMKFAMLAFPMLCIAASFLIYKRKYKIDSKFYEKIIADLKGCGEITGGA